MRILICGVSGMVGHRMWQELAQSGHDVMGTVHRGLDEFAGWDVFDDRVVEHFEAAAVGSAEVLLDRIQPTVIVNCLGITKRKAEASDLARMYQVNTLFPHQLARWAARNSSRVIQFSTDCVFDGQDGEYDERSVVTATDLYGQTKFFGELDYDHCLTLRTSMIGRELAGRTELLEWFLAQQGRVVSGFVNARYSGLTTNAMARILRRLVDECPTLSGKYQVSGPTISKYELLCKIRDAFGLEVSIAPERGFVCDRTLLSQRFERETGITVPTWDEMLADLTTDRVLYDRAR